MSLYYCTTSSLRVLLWDIDILRCVCVSIIQSMTNQGRARSQYLCCSRGTAAAEKAGLSSSQNSRRSAQETLQKKS